MRLKKGSKVEVFHDGHWNPAEILCGNGHTYSVQFDNKFLQVQKIPRKSIRPCPPLKEKLINWKCGDLVEVLIHGSWRNAKVTGVAFGNNFVFVMLIDESKEISVKRNNVRLRHVWLNNKWTTIKKDFERINEAKKRKLADCGDKGDAKRPRVESNKIIRGAKYNDDNSRENESTVSSSGSCSTSGGTRNYASFNWANDDAMSSSEPIKKVEKSDGKSLKRQESEAHKLEIDAYNSTLCAFYSNGSISWGQEEILSNLRLCLNITLDEHKRALRSLEPSRKI